MKSMKMRRKGEFAGVKTTQSLRVPSKARGGCIPMNFPKPQGLAILSVAFAMSVGTVLAQQTTQQQTTETTTTTSATASVPAEPATHHQLKKDEKADKAQAKADKAAAKAVDSKKVRDADQKQADADRAAAKANSPY